MSDSPFTADDYLLAEDIFREAVEANIAEEDNYALIQQTFTDMVARQWSSGSFMVQVERLVTEHMWSRVNGKAGRATYRMLQDVHNGQTTMHVDEWLDQVLTVGSLRRTTMRNLARTDLVRMIESRAENAKRAAEALAVTRDAAAKLDSALAVSGSITQALRLGVLHLSAPIEGEAA